MLVADRPYTPFEEIVVAVDCVKKRERGLTSLMAKLFLSPSKLASMQACEVETPYNLPARLDTC